MTPGFQEFCTAEYKTTEENESNYWTWLKHLLKGSRRLWLASIVLLVILLIVGFLSTLLVPVDVKLPQVTWQESDDEQLVAYSQRKRAGIAEKPLTAIT